MKDMTRANRRFLLANIKKKRSKYWYGAFLDNPVALGKLVHTATLCSCHMCGNERKYGKGDSSLTIQERRFYSVK